MTFSGRLPFLFWYNFKAVSKEAVSPFTISSLFACTTALLYQRVYDEFRDATNAVIHKIIL